MRLCLCLLYLITAQGVRSLDAAKVYEVGPGYLFTSPVFVPWHMLNPGDIVQIHWREKAYRARWAISRQGTEEFPIFIQGISGPDGQQPIIEGDHSFTAVGPEYKGSNRAVIRIGSAPNSGYDKPANILVENLHLRGANKENRFANRDGSTGSFLPYAAGIHVESGHNITVRGCTFENNGIGMMTSHQSEKVVIEECHFYDNGYPGDIYTHNLYTATLHLTVRKNRFCPLKEGALGNNIKDRSAGLHIHSNTIVGGNKLLDLVDAEDSEVLREHPDYHEALVENNLLIKPPNSTSGRILHFGGDSENVPSYRKRLVFRENTVLTMYQGITSIFRAETNDQHILAEKNLFYQPSEMEVDSRWQITGYMGHIEMVDNRIKGRWYNYPQRSHKNEVPRIQGQETFIKVEQAQWTPPTPPCRDHIH